MNTRLSRMVNSFFNLSAINELAGRNEYIKDSIKVQSAKTISGYVYASAGVNESTTNSVMSGYATILETGKVITENERFNFENNLIYTEIDVKKISSIRKKSISYTYLTYTFYTFSSIYSNSFKNIFICLGSNPCFFNFLIFILFFFTRYKYRYGITVSHNFLQVMLFFAFFLSRTE